MPLSFKDFTQLLGYTSADSSDEEKLTQVMKQAEPGLVSKAWDAINRPAALSEDAYIPQLRHKHADTEGGLRKGAEDLAASFTSPLTAAFMGTGVAGMAGKAAGKLGQLAEVGMQVPILAHGGYKLATGDSGVEQLGGALEAGLGAYGLHHSMHPSGEAADALKRRIVTDTAEEAADVQARKMANSDATEHIESTLPPSRPGELPSPEELARIKADYDANGGVTYNLHDGNIGGTDKYAVAAHPNQGTKSKVAPTESDILEWIKERLGLLSQKDNSFGGWTEGKGADQQHFLDVSRTTPDIEDALTTARATRNLANAPYDQQEKAIFDLKNFKSIYARQDVPPGANPEIPLHEASAEAGPEFQRLVSANATGEPKTNMHEGHIQELDNPGKPRQLLAPVELRQTGPAATPRVKLLHRTNQPNLTELDPEKFGTGLAGEEVARAQAFPNEFPQRTYYTREHGQVEPKFSKLAHTYETEVDEHKLYDIGKDELGLVPKVQAMAHGSPGATSTYLERAILDSGFDGYFHSTHENPVMRDGVVLFKKQPVVETEASRVAAAKLRVKALNEGINTGEVQMPEVKIDPTERMRQQRAEAAQRLSELPEPVDEEADEKLSSALDYMRSLKEAQAEKAKLGSWKPSGGSTALAIGAPAASQSDWLADKPEDDQTTKDRKALARAALMAAGGAGAFGAVGYFPEALKAKLDAVRTATIDGFKLRGEIKRDSVVRTNVRKAILEHTGGDKQQAELLNGLYHTIEMPADHKGINFDQRMHASELLKKGRTNDVEFKNFTTNRLDAAYEEGSKAGAVWGNPQWIADMVNHDPELAVKFGRTIGALSPGAKTDWNAVQAAEVFVRHVLNGEPLDNVLSNMQTIAIKNIKGKRINLERMSQGGRIFGEKTENLSGAELGIKGRIPIDLWLMRAFGAHTDKTPGKVLYRAFEDAFKKYSAAKGEDPFTAMAKIWTGMQKIAGAETPSWENTFKQMGVTGDLTNPEYRQWFLDNASMLRKKLLKAEGREQWQSMIDDIPEPPLTQKKKMAKSFLRETQREFLQSQHEGDVLGRYKTTKEDARRLEEAMRAQGVQPRAGRVPF